MNLFFKLFAVVSLLVSLCSCHHTRGSSSKPLRVMTYNIHHGRGMDDRVDLERIAALIREADVDLVALQEVDKGTERTDRRDLAAELAKLTGMKHVFEKNIDYQGGEYGNAILSRLPIITHTNHHYQMLRPGEQRGLLLATVQNQDREVIFASTHLDHRPDPSERQSNVAELRSLFDSLDRPIVIAGDFNDHPGSDVHQGLSEFLTDAWRSVGDGDGFTYSSTQPKSRIDYVWLAPRESWRVLGANVLGSEASDHLPLVVELILSDD